jgi:hypothetical protein
VRQARSPRAYAGYLSEQFVIRVVASGPVPWHTLKVLPGHWAVLGRAQPLLGFRRVRPDATQTGLGWASSVHGDQACRMARLILLCLLAIALRAHRPRPFTPLPCLVALGRFLLHLALLRPAAICCGPGHGQLSRALQVRPGDEMAAAPAYETCPLPAHAHGCQGAAGASSQSLMGYTGGRILQNNKSCRLCAVRSLLSVQGRPAGGPDRQYYDGDGERSHGPARHELCRRTSGGGTRSGVAAHHIACAACFLRALGLRRLRASGVRLASPAGRTGPGKRGAGMRRLHPEETVTTLDRNG